jgi:two-component system, response regulator PdtaR
MTNDIHILIVEDDIIIATDLKIRLQNIGYQVVGIAKSSNEATHLFQQHEIDLLLMDINIQGEKDGIETAQHLQNQRITPLIYLTALADQDTIERAKITRPSAYLTKPFNEVDLQVAIDIAINNFAYQKKSTLPNEQQNSNADLNADNILRMNDTIFVKQNYRFQKLQLTDIQFIKADNHYSDIILEKKKITLRMSLQSILDRLNSEDMLRVHRSYAINTKFIEEFNDTEIIIGKHTIPIGQSYKANFLSRFDFL